MQVISIIAGSSLWFIVLVHSLELNRIGSPESIQMAYVQNHSLQLSTRTDTHNFRACLKSRRRHQATLETLSASEPNLLTSSPNFAPSTQIVPPPDREYMNY